MNKAEAAVPASCAHHKMVANIEVPIRSIEVPELYVGGIPDNLKTFYKLLGIKFVCVKSGPVEYYIFEPLLAEVIKKHDLAFDL